MKIVHDDEFNSTGFVGFLDELYFRLYHNLQEVQQTHRADIEVVVGAAERPMFIVHYSFQMIHSRGILIIS